MAQISKNIALGAAAVGAGAVLVGATLLTSPKSPLSINNGSGSGGGNTVSVTVREINPAITISSPAANDVFLSPQVSLSVNYKDTISVALSLTAPNGSTCDLGTVTQSGDDWSSASGATYTANLNLTECQDGSYGAYTLNAVAPGLNVSASRAFSYSTFGFGNTTFDGNGDPVIFIEYGQGIGEVTINATCANNVSAIENMHYIPENNEDKIDEILLPFKNKNIPAGDCLVEATAHKANGEPLNSQDVSGATVRTSFTYTGL